MKDPYAPLSADRNVVESTVGSSISYWNGVVYRFKHNRAALLATVILGILLLFAVVGPHLNSHTYYETTLELKNQAPNSEYWFGTDDLGRDMFTRVWYGARISLFIGVAAALIDMVLGILWGGIAALLGGRWDEILMRTADVLYGIPYMLVVILLMVVLGSGLLPILIAMSITGWINMARIVRGQFLQLKQLDYVQAAVAMGARRRRILIRHLLPNAMGPIIVTMTLTIPYAIFVEAFLSFLGLGIQAPIASWGTMASDGLPAMTYYPWRLFFPTCLISLTMLAFNIVGDGLRDALDPRVR